MKKLLLILSVLLLLQACKPTPLLNKDEYVVRQILNIDRNGFGDLRGFKAIISVDSVYHYGELNSDGVLIYVNPRHLKVKPL